MRTAMLSVAITCALTVAAVPASAQAVDATALVFDAPGQAALLESKRFKGDPVRLSWSPDGREIYVQFAERDRRGDVKRLTHAVVELPSKVRTVDAEPAWSAPYWTSKSAQFARAAPAFRITAESHEEVVRATGTPMGGDLARGGTTDAGGGSGAGAGVSVDEVSRATNQSQKVVKWTLTLKGETIGEWVNQAVAPGQTFGWHADRPLIAYRAKSGALVVMDDAARRQTVGGVDDVLLPAWSADGSRLAALAKSGRRGWTLVTIDVR